MTTKRKRRPAPKQTTAPVPEASAEVSSHPASADTPEAGGSHTPAAGDPYIPTGDEISAIHSAHMTYDAQDPLTVGRDASGASGWGSSDTPAPPQPQHPPMAGQVHHHGMTEEEMLARLQATAKPKNEGGPSLVDIHADAVPMYWDRIEDLIRSAINASPVQPKLETPNDVRRMLIEGFYRLHLVIAEQSIRLVLVTQLQTFSRTRVCHIVYGAGQELEQWIQHFKDRFAEGAREQGCRFLQIHAGETQGQILQRCGFVESARVYTMEI